MRGLGIDFISAFALPPVEYVELAAELGAPTISMGLNRMEYNPEGYAPFSLREDKALRREVKAALAATGVEIGIGENLLVAEGPIDLDGWRADLDILSELGTRRVNSVSIEPDFAQNIDKYGALTELCQGYGIDVLIEFVPIFGVVDLQTARAVVEKLGAPNCGLVIDTMHCGRTGITAADLAQLPPELVGYIQLCDAPWKSELDYIDEAMHERRVPGEGELPLREYLAALPRDVIVSLEVPDRPRAEAGQGPRERLAYALGKGREILSSL